MSDSMSSTPVTTKDLLQLQIEVLDKTYTSIADVKREMGEAFVKIANDLSGLKAAVARLEAQQAEADRGEDLANVEKTHNLSRLNWVVTIAWGALNTAFGAVLFYLLRH